MTTRRKGLLVLVLAAAVFLALTGWESDLLPQARDITQVKLIRTLALDQGEGARLRLTASGDLRKEGDGGQAQPPLILTQEAGTVSAGCAGLQEQSDGWIEFGHLAECVIGEPLARQGLGGIADYVSRDFSMRMESKVFLVAGADGEEAVRGAASKNSAVTDRLAAISQNRSLGGRVWPYTFRTLISQLEDNGSALLPALTLAENPDYNPEEPGEQPEQELQLSGLAFLEDGRLAGYLTAEESAGAALITDQNQRDTMEVTLTDGSAVGVQLLCAQRTLEAAFDEEGRLTAVTVRIQAAGELNEVSGAADPMDPAVLEQIDRGFREQLRLWAQAALDRSRTEGIDFLHLRRSLLGACPLRAGEILADWEQRFPTLTLTAEIQGRVERSYDIDRPMRPADGTEGSGDGTGTR